jgi:hypothetical protein
MRSKVIKTFEMEEGSTTAMCYQIIVRDASGQQFEVIIKPTQREAYEEMERRGYRISRK